MNEDYQPEPYKVTLAATEYGKYKVEVLHDLCWACIFVNGVCYEALGTNSAFWLFTHDAKGSTSTPLERLLHMIRTNRDPDRLSKEERVGFEGWLRDGAGGRLVAAWREAHARAKHFCEHPHDVRDAVRDELVSRWQREPAPEKKHVLERYLPKVDRARLGLEQLPF